MRTVSLSSAEFTYDETDPPGFRSGMARFGPALGARHTGATLYELPAGEALCPYHYEYGEEEWLFVVAGTPTVRHPGGSDTLAPGDLAFFPTGPEGAHRVQNDSAETVRVLMWSDVVLPTGTAYPDSGKVALWTGDRDEDVIARRGSAVAYFDGEE